MISYEEAIERLPHFLIDKLLKAYGEDNTKKIIEGYCIERKVTFRVNTLKIDNQSVENKLIELGIEYEKVSWSDEAYISNNVREKEIQEMEMYKNGEIYLQSLSSMLPPIVLNPIEGADILDMTAAPGGKTTQMAALSKNKANITACEKDKIRAERLKYNIEKQGANCVYIMLKDARQIDDFFSFDQILLDSPCSGSGTLAIEDTKLEKTFTLNLINKCKISQIALLKKAIKILKPGKEMIYSTCSILKEENEEIVKQVLKEQEVEIVPIKFKGMEDLQMLPTSIKGTICVCPSEYYEGFFIAKIRKIKWC